MTFSEQLNAARTAILDRHADGLAKIVTILRKPIDRLGQYARLERWQVSAETREALSAEDINLAGEITPEILRALQRGELYVELSAEPAPAPAPVG